VRLSDRRDPQILAPSNVVACAGAGTLSVRPTGTRSEAVSELRSRAAIDPGGPPMLVGGPERRR
jgi:hypothetical protein